MTLSERLRAGAGFQTAQRRNPGAFSAGRLLDSALKLA